MARIPLNSAGEATATSAPMSDAMRADLKALASQRGTSMSTIIREAVGEYLKRHQGEPPGKAA